MILNFILVLSRLIFKWLIPYDTFVSVVRPNYFKSKKRFAPNQKKVRKYQRKILSWIPFVHYSGLDIKTQGAVRMD